MAREKHTPHACSATFVRGDFGEMPAHEAISSAFKNTTFIREKVETSYTIEFAKLMLLPSVVANTLRGTTRTKLRCLRAEQCCRVLQPAAVLWVLSEGHARLQPTQPRIPDSCEKDRLSGIEPHMSVLRSYGSI